MNVFYLLHRFPVPSETFIYDEMVILGDDGYGISAIAAERGVSAQLPPEFESIRPLVLRPQFGSRAIAAAAAAPGFLFRLLRHPAAWRLVGGLARRRRYLLFHVAQIARAWPREQSAPEIVVCHFATMAVVIEALKRLRVVDLDLPVVVVVHGFDVSAEPQRIGPSLLRESLVADSVTVVTIADAHRPALERLGVHYATVRYLGVRSSDFTKRVRTQPVNRAIRVLTVGRLTEKKGHALTLRALAILAEDYDWTYTIAGGGPLREDLERLAEELGVSARTRFIGALGRNDVRLHLDEADVFVLASHEAGDGGREGIPVALMEAMASGIPVVTTRHSGIPELVVGGDSGLLVDEGSSDALAQGLRRLFSEGDLWQRLSQGGCDRVESAFDLDKNTSSFAGMLDEIVANSRSAA